MDQPQSSTPTTTSILQKNTDELLQKASKAMSEPQYTQYKLILQRFERAKQLKYARYKYYDGMDYDQDYASNENLKNTYLTPKANESEVRVNTGTSEKKLDAIKNELLTMHVKQEVKAFDKNDMEINRLGEDFTDLVDRTNQMEKEDDVMEEATDELLSQRVLYLRETYQPMYFMRRQEVVAICKKELVSGLKVFPGTWTLPAYLWDLQPYVVSYDKMPYEQAKAAYGHLPAFDHVQPSRQLCELYLGGAFSYTFGELQDGEVEIILYESLPDNEKQLVIGGVPMYAPQTKLDLQVPHYSLRAYTTKSMSRHFLGGRPFTVMSKGIQGISNELLRSFIRKTQQSVEPPHATRKGGKIYSRNIFDPGTWTHGMSKDDYSKLIDHEGVTQGEMAMYEKVDQEVEKFIGTPNLVQGIQSTREMSATEVLTITKQFLKQLGYVVATLMRVRRDLTEMRIYNIMENYLDPVGKEYNDLTKNVQDVYRSFTSQRSMLDNGRKGKKIIKFIDRDLSQDEQRQLYDFEEAEEKKGNLIRQRFINAKKLKEFPIFFYVSTSIQDKEGTALDKVTFQDQLNQAAGIMKITGKQVNGDVISDEFERKWKAHDWFNVPADQTMSTPGMESPVSKEAGGLLSEIEGFENSLGEQVSRGTRSGAKTALERMSAQEVAVS